jgi:two-component sensor histidine kinase
MQFIKLLLNKIKNVIIPFKIVIIYLIIGSLWILFSDNLVFLFFKNIEEMTFFSIIKGLFYVFFTAVLLFFLINNETKKTIANLEISQVTMTALFDSTDDIIWSVDSKDFGLLNYNKAFKKYFSKRLNKDVKIGMSPKDLLPAERALIWNKFFYQVLKTGQFQTEFELLTKNRYLLLSFSLLKKNDKVFGISIFGKDITNFKKAEIKLRNYKDHLENIVEQRTKELEQTLSEKETLLKEIHHRVKNNMQIISALLDFQKQNASDKSIDDIFNVSIARIKSMALVHEKLYQPGNLSKINAKNYFQDLFSYMIFNYYENKEKIKYQITIDENLFFDIDIMIPLGLIMNELIMNSLKHAFTDTKNCLILLSIICEGNKISINYSDNGKGIKDFNNNKNSLGMTLITNLVKQISGNMEIKNNSGAQFFITFEI